MMLDGMIRMAGIDPEVLKKQGAEVAAQFVAMAEAVQRMERQQLILIAATARIMDKLGMDEDAPVYPYPTPANGAERAMIKDEVS